MATAPQAIFATITDVRPGPIAYVDLIPGAGNIWGAVRPGVDRLTIGDKGAVSPNIDVFRTQQPDEEGRLINLGDGWSAFNTDHGFVSTGRALEVVAYQGAKVVDRADIELG